MPFFFFQLKAILRSSVLKFFLSFFPLCSNTNLFDDREFIQKKQKPVKENSFSRNK